ADVRQSPQHQQPEDGNGGLELRVNAERMLQARDVLRQEQAADAHAAHERAEEHAHRSRLRTDEEAQQWEPNELVPERRGAAADEQQDQQRKKPVLHRGGLGGRSAGGVGLGAAWGFGSRHGRREAGSGKEEAGTAENERALSRDEKWTR